MIEIGNNLRDVLQLATLMVGFVLVLKIVLEQVNHK